jgi:hypothetical protein
MGVSRCRGDAIVGEIDERARAESAPSGDVAGTTLTGKRGIAV